MGKAEGNLDVVAVPRHLFVAMHSTQVALATSQDGAPPLQWIGVASRHQWRLLELLVLRQALSA